MAGGRTHWWNTLAVRVMAGTLLVLAAVCVLVGDLWFERRHHERDDAVQSLTLSADLVAGLVGGAFDDAVRFAARVAADPELRAPAPNLQQRLAALVGVHAGYDALVVTDPSGAAVASAEARTGAAASPAALSYLRERVAATGRPAIVTVGGADDAAPLRAAAGAPIVGADGAPGGLVVVIFGLESIDERIAAVRLLPHQTIALVDPTGRLIRLLDLDATAPQPLTWEQRDRSGVPGVQAALRGETTVSTSFGGHVAGGERMAVWLPVRHGWVVASTWPVADALAGSHQAELRELVVLAAIILVVLINALLASLGLVRPLKRLADHAAKLGSDDFQPIQGITSNDEIGRLAQALNTMGQRLHETLRDLRSERNMSEAVFAHLPVGVLVVGADDREVIRTNGIAEQYLPTNTAGQPAYDPSGSFGAHHLDGRPYRPEERPLGRVLRSGVPVIGDEIVLRRPNMPETRLRTNTAPVLDHDGRMVAVVQTFEDLTEHRLSERSVRDRDELLRALFEQFPASVKVVDRDFRVVLATPDQNLGTAREGDVVGLTLDQLLPAHLVAQARTEVRDALAGLTSRAELRTNDRVYSVVVCPLRDANGAITRVMAFQFDITEERRTEDALRDREALLEALVDQFPAALSVVDRDLRIVMLAGQRLVDSGVPNSEVVGRPMDEFLPVEDARRYTELVASAFAGGPVVISHQANGRFLRGTITPMRGADGTIDRVLNVIYDITEERRIEAQIAEREALLEALVEQFPAALNVVDRDYRFVMVAGKRYFAPQLSNAQLTGEPMATIVPPEVFSTYAASAQRAFAGETVMIDVTANERVLRTTITPLRNAAGEVDRVLNIVFDVTEEMARIEQATREEKLRALGQMAGGIAHDLNQALALVSGYGELARDALAAEPPNLATVQEMIRIMERAAYDGGETVKQLLTFARGETNTRFEAVDIASLLDEVAQLTAPRWRASTRADGHSVAVTVEAASGQAMNGSPPALREALTNLVFNSLDAMPDGGSVVLAARQEGGRVLIEVRDTGTGMSPEVAARVFEPFYTTKGSAGTGLGMSMVFGIVERHGGHVDLTSAPGRGTTVRLAFPSADSTPPTAAAEAIAVAAPCWRVLVVDDDAKLAALAVTMLTRDGHQATMVTSGEAALERLRAERFDLVISDISMGDGMNGWDLAAEIGRSVPGLPIVLATGWGAAIDEAEARGRGVSGVMAKPYRRADLRAVMAQALAASPGRTGAAAEELSRRAAGG